MQSDSYKILHKLLWEEGFRWQLIGAIAGAFLGLLLLLLAAQLYFDLQTLLNGENDNSGHFIQLNKKVNIFNTIGGASGFSEIELENIEDLDAVESVGVFTSNAFKAGAYSDMLGFYTELFFEAVPNEFLDVEEPHFRWSEGRKEIPVLVARDYLALYNFGFAPSQGLPQISAKSARRLVMDVRLEGKGKRQTFEGRVVGFTDRINSILVPADFMEWANQEFGNDDQKRPARIILKVANPLDKELLGFIGEKGYEISTGRLIGEEIIVIFKIVITALAILALVILLLAALVFVMAFELVISKNESSIKLMLEQGFEPRTISKLVENKFLKIFSWIILSVFIMLFFIRFLLADMLENQGFDLSVNLHVLVYLLGAITIGALFWQNITKIRIAVNSLA